MVDVLHTVDLGLTTHIVGNVIWWLVVMCACFGGRTFADRISACGANLKQWYKDNGFKNRLRGKLTPERVREVGEWPQMKSNCKAAPLRTLARYALYLIQTFWPHELR